MSNLDVGMGKLCILLPVLNEEGNIERLLAGIDAALDGRPYTLCILDDGSRDRTREIVSAAAVEHPGRIHLITRQKVGRGSQRGGALLTSLQWALEDPEHALFVEMDGDLSHRPEELPIGLARLASAKADVVIASKYIASSSVTNRPWSRRAVSMICNTMVRALLSPDVHDYSNGYRFYNRRAAELIASTQIKYGSPIYLSEVMGIWLRAGLKIEEMPTTYIGRNEGVSKLRYIDILKAGIAVFEIALRLHIIGFRIAEPKPGLVFPQSHPESSPRGASDGG